MIPYSQDRNKKKTNDQLLQEILRLRQNLIQNRKNRKSDFISRTSRKNGIIITDSNGYIVSMNKTASEITGWQSAKAAGKPIDDVLSLINQNYSSSLRQHIVELINKRIIKTAIINGCVHVKKEKEKEIEYSAGPLMNENGRITGTMFVLHKNPVKNYQEMNPIESIKLNALALLAGEIAHDYNNILTILSGNIAVARTCGDIDDELLNIFAETEIALKRAKDLTEKLRLLSKGSKPEKKALVLEDLLKEITQGMLFESPVTCSFSFQTDLWPLEADKIQIRRVIQNLILNAKQELISGGKRESFSGGKINIHVKNALVGDNEVPDLRAGHYIHITIADNGPGIPDKNLHRIFEPYFTTKPDAQGLGLTTASAIIKRHKGNIKVESREGKGTTFHIFLPAMITD